MAIPESQLETWSHQGSITQSKDTYATIKGALEDSNTKYADRNFQVLLQGSYGNDTNVFAESDVDVVIRYDGAFYSDITALPADEQRAYNAWRRDGTYPYSAFKGHVQAALESAFGRSVEQQNKKAIKIRAYGARRNADVLVAFEFRRFYRFNSESDQKCEIGIAFFASDNTRIINYPRQHSDNCTAKHQAVGNNFKPLVRIFKNIRSKLVSDGRIAKETAPSYFIEGLLYNVPNEKFAGTYADQVFKILDWLHRATDRSKFVCVNEQYYLLRDNDPVCWPLADGERFVSSVVQLWNNW